MEPLCVARNISANGRYLWLAACYYDVVYRFDTQASGAVEQIKVWT